MNELLIFLMCVACMSLGFWLGYGVGYNKGTDKRDELWDSIYLPVRYKGSYIPLSAEGGHSPNDQ